MNLSDKDLEMRCEAYPGLTCSSYNCLESGQCELRNMDTPDGAPKYIVCPLAPTTSRDGTVCHDPQCVAIGGCLPATATATAAVDTVIQPGMGAPVHKPAAAPKANTVAATACHWGAYNLGKIGKATLWVGRINAFASDKAPDLEPYRLLIGANGEAARDETMLVTGNGAAAATVPPSLLITVPNIVINWEDFNTPTLNREWWVTLVNYIATLDGAVGVYCTGGHGRSGTAAVIIATLGGLVHESQDPVEWLRSIYCKDVVESAGQIAYIEQMTGRKVTAKPGFTYATKQWDLWETSADKRSIVSAAKAVVNKVQAAKNSTRALSKSQWKKWRKRNNLAPKRHPDDNETVKVAGHYFAWDGPGHRFTWLGSEEEWDGIVDDNGNMKKDVGIR